MTVFVSYFRIITVVLKKILLVLQVVISPPSPSPPNMTNMYLPKCIHFCSEKMFKVSKRGI